jgi:hypothetical protein
MEFLFGAIEEWVARKERYVLTSQQKDALREYIFNIDGVLAAERISETVDELELDRSHTAPFPTPNLGQRLKRGWLSHLGGKTWDYVAGLVPGRGTDYKDRKFSTTTREEMCAEFRQFDPYVEYDMKDIEIDGVQGLRNVFKISR